MSNALQAPAARPKLGYLSGVGTVFSLEMRQRMRSRGWYVMLAVWFAAIALVAGLAALTSGIAQGTGQLMFELVVGFVLFFGLLVAPALSANAITGDRSAGTLAILQNTLLTPGQLLWGKWLAAWAASLAFLAAALPLIAWAMLYGDVYLPGVPAFLLMLAVELGIVCAIGVGVSARANRPLFAIVSAYLLVALLGLGTLIVYGLSFALVKETVSVSEQSWPNDPWAQVEYDDSGLALDENGQVIADQEAYFAMLDSQWDPNAYVCGPATYQTQVFHTERTTWLLAANPFVVVADAVPSPRAGEPERYSSTAEGMAVNGPMAGISQGVRLSQAGAEFQQPCINGVKRTDPLPGGTPVWPLGLGLQALLAATLVFLGRRRLVTPAGKLAPGTRIA